MPPSTDPTLLRASDAPTSPVPAPLPTLVGERLGSFRLVRELGRGGMGTVYLGEHELIGSQVAVKVLHRHLAGDPQLVERFLAEARAVNLIGHENIVRIFDMNRAEDGSWFLVMEYLEGKVLSEFATAALPEQETRAVLAQLCDALGAAHARGIVHRDVKPENVMILEQPLAPAERRLRIKLLDFGIARFFRGLSSAKTSVGTVLGTPAFMAPEQWSTGTADARADLHAVGVMGLLLATGKHPFENFDLGDLLSSTRRVPEHILEATPVGLRELLVRATQPRPENRFSSAEELSRALRSTAVTPPAFKAPAAPSFPVDVNHEGKVMRSRCIDPRRGGTFLCTDETPPPLRAIVRLELKLPGGELACRGEVVRHVSRADAERWNHPAGYAVQFLEGTKAFGAQLAALIQGESPAPAAESSAVVLRIRDLSANLGSDHYRFLGLPRDASFHDVRRRTKELETELGRLSAATLSSSARERLTRVNEQIYLAVRVLSEPVPRAEYDASLRNFRGVARCIAKGLSPAELAKLQARWRSDHPRESARARMQKVSGDFLLRSGELEQAVAQYEAGLQLDPLDGGLHQAYWSTRRQLLAAPPSHRAKAS